MSGSAGLTLNIAIGNGGDAFRIGSSDGGPAPGGPLVSPAAARGLEAGDAAGRAATSPAIGWLSDDGDLTRAAAWGDPVDDLGVPLDAVDQFFARWSVPVRPTRR
jgi:hypothetical protein